MKRLLLLVVAVVFLVSSCSSPGGGSSSTATTLGRPTQTPTPAVHVPADRFGIASGVAISRADESEMNRDLDGYKSLGARWVRTTLKWNDVQPGSRTSFDWSAADRLIDGAVQRGLRVVLVVNGTPSWAQPAGAGNDPSVPPANLQDYADFLRQAVLRYKEKGVHHWELGNEPNHDTGWSPTPDPVRYAELLRDTYPVIKAADPQSVVLTGGLGGVDDKTNKIAGNTFLAALYKNGAKGYFDVVSYHPYTYPAMPSDQARSWERMLNARQIMVQNGDGDKQIWATEYGAPTGGPRKRVIVSEDQQAAMVTDAYSLFGSYPWSGPLFWFSYRDKGTDQSGQKNFFGLVRVDYSPKAAAGVYRQLASGGQ